MNNEVFDFHNGIIHLVRKGDKKLRNFVYILNEWSLL